MSEIRPARGDDVPAMVALSAAKRRAYARQQPVFWREAVGADEAQRRFFLARVEQPEVLAFVAEHEESVVGFALGVLAPAPPVYDPGGLTCTVDDFAVEDARSWATVGAALLAAVRSAASARGAVLAIVVCGAHDEPKRALLASQGLTVASEWYVGPTAG